MTSKILINWAVLVVCALAVWALLFFCIDRLEASAWFAASRSNSSAGVIIIILFIAMGNVLTLIGVGACRSLSEGGKP